MCDLSNGSFTPQSNEFREMLKSLRPAFTLLMISCLRCFGEMKFGLSL